MSCSVGNRDLQYPVKVSRHLCAWKFVPSESCWLATWCSAVGKLVAVVLRIGKKRIVEK